MSLKKLPLTLGIALIVSAALIMMLTVHLSKPMFTITNVSTEPVFVSVSWRDKTKDFGLLETSEQLQFNIADEAALVIKARTGDDREVISAEIYFSRDIAIKAEISATDIRVYYSR